MKDSTAPSPGVLVDPDDVLEEHPPSPHPGTKAGDGFVVEIVGPAGVGKSLIVPLVVEQLRNALGQNRVSVLSPHPLKSDLSRFGRFTTLLTSPYLLVAAASMPLPQGTSRSARMRRWVSVFTTMRTARRLAKRKDGICIVEQGAVHYLRQETELLKLPKGMLPDLVIEITAHPATVLERRLSRSKSVRKAEQLRGQRRRQQAERLAGRFADIPIQAARELLRQWSDTYCVPPLTVDQLEQALGTGRSRMPREHPDDSWSRANIRALLRPLLRWSTIRNETETPPEAVAQTIAATVVQLMSPES